MNGSAVPLKLQQATIQHSIDQTKANFEKNKELSNLLEEVREKCTKEINVLLGSKAKEYREFHEKSREIARTMQPLFTATPEGRKIKSQFQKTRLDESNKFIRSLGINVNDFKSIISKYQKESKSIIENTRKTEGSLELEVSPIPPDVINPDPDSPWQSFHPPYFNGVPFGSAYSVHSGDAAAFPPVTLHYENYLTGEISCHTQNFIYNAGDYAHQTTVGSSNLFLLIPLQRSGRLNIWTQLQCVESSNWGFLSNWLGYSDSTTMRSSKYYISVGEAPGEEELYFRLLDDSRHTDDDVEWSGNMAMPGEYRTFNLVTDISYSAGQWIRMRTGILDVQDAVCDDMSFFGDIKNKWILTGVWLSTINP